MRTPLSAEMLLDRLVGFPTVFGHSNLDLMGFVADYLEGHRAKVHLLTGPEGDRANLFSSFGDVTQPGYVLSAHVDVVPAQEPELRADPVVLPRDGDRLIGCDSF